MSDERLGRTPAVDPEALAESVSAYKLRVWSDCQAKFELLYVDGLWAPPSPAAAWGSAYDAMSSAGYRDKRETGRDPQPEDAAAKFAAAFDEEREQVEDWGGERPGELLDEGAAHARFWACRTAPEVVPIDVQRRFAIRVADWTVRGVVDLTMELLHPPAPALAGKMIVDWKTTRRSWNRAKAASQLQSVFYALAADVGQLSEGVDPSRVGYEVMVRLKRGPKRQRFVVGVGKGDRAHVLHRVDLARRAWTAAARAGAFPPNREHFLCSRRQCHVWRQCEKRHGGRVRD